MKYRIFIIFILLCAKIGAHQSNVHLYIVAKAYYLLEKKYLAAGGDINDLNELKYKIFRANGTQDDDGTDENTAISWGVYNEDVSDIIFRLGWPFTTNTHFWDADKGVNSTNDLPGTLNTPNAFTKACMMLILTNDNKLSVNDKYKLLGRVIHLLEDMSVPAHAHIDPHPVEDYYDDVWAHNNVEYRFDNYVSITGETGFMSYLSCINENDALLYLFYTMNQIAGFFPSDDRSANNNFDDTNVIVKEKFTEWGICAGDFSKSLCPEIADKTINYCIGAVATLYYLFELKLGRLSTTIKTNSFDFRIASEMFTARSGSSIKLLPGFAYIPHNANSHFKTSLVGCSIESLLKSQKEPLPDKVEDVQKLINEYIKNMHIDSSQIRQLQLSGIFSVKIYPNPATDMITIATNNSRNFTFYIYNHSGTLLQSGPFAKSIQINIQDLTKGIYILKIINSQSNITKKFVKN